MELLYKAVADNGLVAAFAVVGILLWISGVVSRHIFRGRIQASAIAILGALALAYLGGALTGKAKGLSDVTGFAGLALMGGTMMRDFCIVATASEVRVSEAKKAGDLGSWRSCSERSCRSSSAWASHGRTATSILSL